ncbi:hypothetical protein XENOCAPTIV_009666, partial [Xenoophorus captivus]
QLAAEAGTSYGCYFVPAFSGLYAPYWEPSARGSAEIQTSTHAPCDVCQILDAMNQDCCIPLSVLGVDGGMTGNSATHHVRDHSSGCRHGSGGRSGESEFRFARWKKAVQKAMNWETTETSCTSNGMQLRVGNIRLKPLQESHWDHAGCSLSLAENRYREEDERRPLLDPSYPCPHQSGPLRSDRYAACCQEF